MAGPLIQMLRNMRENRMERRAMGMGPFGGRGGPIRNMLSMLAPPVTQRQALASMQEYVPDEPGAERAFRPVFASLGGTRSAAHDRKGMRPVSPPPRAQQDNPAGPDNIPARPYDGDGNKPADAKPEPVQGGTMTLPDPGTGVATPDAGGATPPALRSPHQSGLDSAMAARESIARAMQNAKSVTEYNALAFQMVNAERDIAHFRGQMDKEREEYNVSPVKFKADLDAAARAALLDGDWTTHALIAKKMVADRNPRTGEQDDPMFLDTAARQMAAPVVLGRAAEVFARYGALEKLPAAEHAALLRGLVHVFPMSPIVQKNPREQVKWWKTVAGQMNNQYNPSGNAALTSYWNSVATEIRDMHIGPINSQ